jgi:hypothetical protein
MKLVFTPSSNHYKWKKQILKQLKRNSGPIHDAVASKSYPDFQEESMFNSENYVFWTVFGKARMRNDPPEAYFDKITTTKN